MAREAGLSAILVPGIAFAVFSSIRTIRRELESGTLQMALAHPVSRRTFLAAKLAGVLGAYGVFFVTVWASSLVAVRGAILGAAAANGDIARVWGPSLAIGTAAIVVPLAAGAVLNRFAGFRFARTAAFTALAVAATGVFYKFDAALSAAHLASSLPLVAPAVFFTVFAGAAAVRLEGNNAASLLFLVAAVSLPVLGAHYIPEAAAGGAPAPWLYAACSLLAVAPLAAAAFIAGAELFNGKDVA